MLVIVETELWPNLVRSAHESGARVILVNARLSDGSFRGYKRFGFFMRRVLENVDSICAQTASDAQRFCILGAPPRRVIVTGNLKFDAAPVPIRPLAGVLKTALSEAGRAPVVVAGSTMPGEEELVLEAWRQIKNRYSHALLIVAPRHPTRFDVVERVLSRRGIQFIRRTEMESAKESLSKQLIGPEIVLLNTIGELPGIFDLADLVFVGGSLVPAGGHNILEPAYWGKPILFGPFMENFRDVATMFIEGGGAVRVTNATELAREGMRLLGDETLRREIGARAKNLLQEKSGATGRVLAQIDQLLQSAPPVDPDAVTPQRQP